MRNIAAIKGLAEVRSTVVGNTVGTLLEAFNEPDGEAVAAVCGFAIHRLTEAGAQLGLGTIGSLSTTGGPQAFLIAVRGDQTLSTRVDPQTSLPALEKKVQQLLDGEEVNR